ncbi:hypothetical protein ACFX13_033351 [Malus domestica]
MASGSIGTLKLSEAGATLEPVDVAAGVEHHVERLRRSPNADPREVLAAALANAADDGGGEVLRERKTECGRESTIEVCGYRGEADTKVGIGCVALEALSLSDGGGSAMARGFQDAPLDPSIVAYEDLIRQFLVRVSAVIEKIGGQMVDITKVLQQAFSTRKDLLIQVKQTQVNLACDAFVFLGFSF